MIKTKHLLLLVASLILVVSSLLIWVPDKKNSQAQDVRFGYPISFVSQDFTLCPYFYTTNWYFKFAPSEKCPIKKIYPLSLIASWGSIFMSLEVLVWLMENLKFKIKNFLSQKFYRKKDKIIKDRSI